MPEITKVMIEITGIIKIAIYIANINKVIMSPWLLAFWHVIVLKNIVKKEIIKSYIHDIMKGHQMLDSSMP